jgi:hypothetical protein
MVMWQPPLCVHPAERDTQKAGEGDAIAGWVRERECVEREQLLMWQPPLCVYTPPGDPR